MKMGLDRAMKALDALAMRSRLNLARMRAQCRRLRVCEDPLGQFGRQC
jgi:hypothetical protein